MFANPTPDQIRSLLQEVKTIAVVGLSPRRTPELPGVPRDAGLRLSHRAGSPGRFRSARRKSLRAPVRHALRGSGGCLPHADEVGPIVDECIALGVKRLWLQDGVINEEAAKGPRGRHHRGDGPLRVA
jgi:hypothetical protein